MWFAPAQAAEQLRPDRFRLDVADVTGRLVTSVPLGAIPPGFHAAWWDGRDARGVAAPAGFASFGCREGQGLRGRHGPRDAAGRPGVRSGACDRWHLRVTGGFADPLGVGR